MNTIHRFEELLGGVRTWGCDSAPYDAVGVLNLMAGCISNLRGRSTVDEIDPESIVEIFSGEEICFMEQIVSVHRAAQSGASPRQGR